MPVEEIARYLEHGESSERKRLYMQLAIHCAPFLKNLKESAMLTLPRKQALELAALAEDAGLNWYFLYHAGNKDMVFLYRRESFERYLSRADVHSFLAKTGYGMQLRAGEYRRYRILARLSHRMEAYYRTKQDFPHEIGVLLGYPAADVEGFIANDGKNCLFTGYWKVYQEEEKARRLFAAFDEAREQTVREVLEGKELRQLCIS